MVALSTSRLLQQHTVCIEKLANYLLNSTETKKSATLPEWRTFTLKVKVVCSLFSGLKK